MMDPRDPCLMDNSMQNIQINMAKSALYIVCVYKYLTDNNMDYYIHS